MRSNQFAKPAKATGTPKKGNGKPYANMPANNVGQMPVHLGNSKGSKVVGHSNGTSAGKSGTVDSTGAHINSTNFVNTGNKVKMGSTNHGVGKVPAYLRNPKNPDTHNINN